MILCLLLGLAGAIYWILVYMWSLGRLMFPAITSAALLTALGWGWWLSLRHSSAMDMVTLWAVSG